MVDLQTASLLFNGVDLTMDAPDPTYGYRIRVMSGTDFGNGEAVISDIQSQLQDGDLQRLDRYGNRTASLDVNIDAPGSDTPGADIAAGQAALELAAGFTGWAELQWTSPLAGAETSVMEMTSASVGKILDTGREGGDGTRKLTLTIGARPFVRPTTKDTFDAPATVGATTTTVDTGSATTGWSMLSTAPSPVTNLETNPDFATTVTGYTAGTGTASISATTESGRSTARMGTGTGFNQVSEVNGPLQTVVAGSSVLIASVVSTDAAHSAPFMTTGARVRFYSDTGGTITVGSDQTLTAAGGDWVTRTWTVTVPATAVRMRVYRFQQQLSNTTSSPWWIDKQWTIHIPTGAVAPGTAYFDGATTGTAALTYAWTGTANNSTSTATWTAPALAVVSGTVQGTVYGRAAASIRRNNTSIDATAMASVPYIRVRGTASAFSDGLVTIADNGSGAITPTSYSYNSTTGAYDILIQRPGGFTTLDVTFTRTGGTISTTAGVFVNVDQVDITNNPFATGKVQSRQISIGGSQRTELSLSVLGLDAAGTTPVALGEQVLIHTAAAGSDSRAKFLASRAAAGTVGTPTSDATATSGFYNTLNTTGTPTNFTFAASALLPGNYALVARVMPTTTGTKTMSYRGFVDPTTGDNTYDPPGGATWKTTPLAVGTTGWPTIAQNAWGMLPLGLLRLPPADIQDTGATLTIQIAADTNVRLDDVFLLNADIGQATLVRTDISGSSYSAVTFNAATVDDPDPSVWVGVANGVMIADPTRLQGFEQHQALPGLLQVSSVTPNCATSRLAGSYYRRYGHDVAAKVS